jgi:hypothetical protein
MGEIPEPSEGERDRLGAFISAAKSQHVADDFVVALLKHNGWSERRIYQAFASYYERTLGVPLPERGARIEYAGDAFLYLLVFISLSAWAFASGAIFDALIDRWIPSGLDTSYATTSFRSEVAWELATIIVALPIFAFVSRTIAAGISSRPEMADSGVRKWLTYSALVVTAMCLIGDGIAFLSSFLTGDLTLRFVLKALVLVGLAGGIFTYYLSAVRGEAVEPRRDRVYAASALAVAALALALGFLGVGTPAHARDVALDQRRVDSLSAIAAAVHADYVNHHRSEAPATLDGLGLPPGNLHDPETKAPYEYRRLGGSAYELCATFVQTEPAGYPNYAHGIGRTCFRRNAADYAY